MYMALNIPNKINKFLQAYFRFWKFWVKWLVLFCSLSTMEYGVHGITPSKNGVLRDYPRKNKKC